MAKIAHKAKSLQPWRYGILAAFSVVLAIGSLVGAYILYTYWYPPVLKFADSDLAKAVLIETSRGKIILQLDGKSKFAIAQFTRLVRNGFYDGVRIHRLVPDLLIETGDPLTRYESEKLFWGQGGLSASFKNEINREDTMSEGTVAFTGSKAGTYGSQFFILTKTTSWMNGKHTIIGHVISGMKTVHEIERVPHSITGMPDEDIVIKSMKVI